MPLQPERQQEEMLPEETEATEASGTEKSGQANQFRTIRIAAQSDCFAFSLLFGRLKGEQDQNAVFLRKASGQQSAFLHFSSEFQVLEHRQPPLSVSFNLKFLYL